MGSIVIVSNLMDANGFGLVKISMLSLKNLIFGMMDKLPMVLIFLNTLMKITILSILTNVISIMTELSTCVNSKNVSMLLKMFTEMNTVWNMVMLNVHVSIDHHKIYKFY